MKDKQSNSIRELLIKDVLMLSFVWEYTMQKEMEF